MKHVSTIDIVGDMSIFTKTIQDIAHIGGIVENIRPDGNGNFTVDLSFGDRQSLVEYVSTYYEDPADASSVLSNIKSVYSESDFDLQKWMPEPAGQWVDLLIGLFEVGGEDVKMDYQAGKLLAIYPMHSGDVEYTGPGMMAFKDGDKVRTFTRKEGVPNF